MASSVQSPLADARATQSEKSSWREGRKSIYLVSSSTNAGMTSPESEIPGDQIGLGSATPISTDHQAEDCASPHLIPIDQATAIGCASPGVPPQIDGHNGVASVRSREQSLRWKNSTTRRCGISAFPTDPKLSVSSDTVGTADRGCIGIGGPALHG